MYRSLSAPPDPSQYSRRSIIASFALGHVFHSPYIFTLISFLFIISFVCILLFFIILLISTTFQLIRAFKIVFKGTLNFKMMSSSLIISQKLFLLQRSGFRHMLVKTSGLCIYFCGSLPGTLLIVLNIL